MNQKKSAELQKVFDEFVLAVSRIVKCEPRAKVNFINGGICVSYTSGQKPMVVKEKLHRKIATYYGELRPSSWE